MKLKTLLSSLIFLLFFCGTAAAQKGMSGVGLNVGPFIPLDVDEGETMVGVHVKYYYNISDNFRIQPSAMLNLSEEKVYPGFSLDAHYLFGAPKAIRPYVLGGFQAFGYEKKHIYYHSEEEWCVGPTAGLGLDWRISHSFSLQAEAKSCGNLADDEGNFLVFVVGFSYNF